jgi:ATP-dependent RNA helicase RhlE
MNQFREGTVKFLLPPTSAPGIDIPDVDHGELRPPEVAENRPPRAAPAAPQKGLAVSFCSPEEKPILDEIESFLGKPITVLSIGKNEYNETLILHRDHTDKLTAVMDEIEKAENRGKKKKKRKG